MRLFKSFFAKKADTPELEKQRNEQKRFEIFKYDGMRAQRIGRIDYAIKCFNEAIALQEDFETLGYLAQIYIQTNQPDEARKLLERMTILEPTLSATFLNLANVCYRQNDYDAMSAAAKQAIALDEGNAMGHYLLGKAVAETGDGIMTIAHLTKAIMLKEEFTEARLLRAKTLLAMRQYKEASEDIEAILSINPEEESALLLMGLLKEKNGEHEDAEKIYKQVIELNPFNEQAFLSLGELLIAVNRTEDAIALLDEAVEINPRFAQAYHVRGKAKLQLGDKDGAAEDMKQGLELNPSAAEGLNGSFNNQPLVQQTNVLGL